MGYDSYSFQSKDGTLIKGCHWQHVTTELKGVVIISHGMAETIQRYEAFAHALVQNGFDVYGHSHRGHGETAGAVDRLGYLGESGWTLMVDDLKKVVDLAESNHPGVPIILMGHSMGSYVVRDLMRQTLPPIKAFIISGTGYPSSLELKGALMLSRSILALRRKDLPSKLLTQLSFGSFNNQIKTPVTEFDWLSRDTAEVQKYILDPWCGAVHPASFFKEMSKGLLDFLYKRSEVRETQKLDTPLLFISGESDPVGQNGKGVRKSAQFYQDLGYKVQLNLYPKARHELLNEVNRSEVQEDLLQWIQKAVH